MAEDVDVVKLAIKYKDVFNFDELYKLMHLWLKENSWVDPVFTFPEFKEGEGHEISYLEKDTASGAKDQIIVWELEKIPHNSPYFKYKLKIEFKTIQLKPVEIVHEDQKVKAHLGELGLEMKGVLVLDYQDKWDENGFLKSFHPLWKKRIYKKQIGDHKDELQKDVENLHGAIKRYLNLKGFLMEFEHQPFTPSLSYA